MEYFKNINSKDMQIQGWLKDFLKLQENGLTGHLEVAGFPFNLVSWAKEDIDTTSSNNNPGWWVYEQTAYWLDGMQRCGELLNSEFLLNKAKASFEYVLSHQDEDGYLGPKFLKKTDGWNRWPHVVFFRALLSYYDYTKDERILKAISKHYLNYEVDYSSARDILNIEIMLLVYLKTKNQELLDLAIKNYNKYNLNCDNDLCEKVQLSKKKPYAHGVSYNEYNKLGALLYICTGNKQYLKASINAYKKIDRFFMLNDGLHCSNEFLINNHYMMSHETCNISDYTWAISYLLKATKDGKYADKIENCILNAGIGSIEENFKGLQYFSCPNQIILDSHSNHNLFFKGHQWMSYRPNPGTECCSGNVNRFMPLYCMNLWLQNSEGLFATLFGSNTYNGTLNNQNFKIIEKTNYPFDDQINFTILTKKELSFKFYIRIPSWCVHPTIYVNGKKINFSIQHGFALIQSSFKNHTQIKVCFHFIPKVVTNKQGNYVKMGPLLYAYGMKGTRIIDVNETKQTKDFKAYNIYPNKNFNYAIKEDTTFKIIKQNKRLKHNPWDINFTPIKLYVEAKKVLNWKILHKNKIRYINNLYHRPYTYYTLKGDFNFTPAFPSSKSIQFSNKDYKICLVPYGCAKVRISYFPKIK